MEAARVGRAAHRNPLEEGSGVKSRGEGRLEVMSTMRSGLMVLLAAGLTACAGHVQLNPARVSEVQGAMRAAEAVGANDNPKARLHLQLARDQVAEADRLAREGDGENAGLLLARAEADAALALQLARTEQEQLRAREAWGKVKEFEKGQP